MAVGYVTIGALDGEASGKFYDAVFGPLGSKRKLADGGWIGYGEAGGGKSFMDCHTAVCAMPQNGEPARAGNGIMIAYHAKSQDQVRAAYEGGIENGGKDEGGPGFRPAEATSGFYGAYLRDPTGNKICLFCVV